MRGYIWTNILGQFGVKVLKFPIDGTFFLSFSEEIAYVHILGVNKIVLLC